MIYNSAAYRLVYEYFTIRRFDGFLMFLNIVGWVMCLPIIASFGKWWPLYLFFIVFSAMFPISKLNDRIEYNKLRMWECDKFGQIKTPYYLFYLTSVTLRGGYKKSDIPMTLAWLVISGVLLYAMVSYPQTAAVRNIAEIISFVLMFCWTSVKYCSKLNNVS